MAPQHESRPELRRFLAINFRVGSRENGYLVGPSLVSTRDYRRFHYWDEPGVAVLAADDYEVVRVYPLGLTCGEAALLFGSEFPPPATGSRHAAGWFASDGAFHSAEGWVSLSQYPVIAA